MRLGRYIVFFFVTIYNYGVAQHCSIQDAFLYSAEHFVSYSDSIHALNIGANPQNHNRDKAYFVLNANTIPSSTKSLNNKRMANGRKMIWCASRIEKCIIEKKHKSESFHFYYRVTLNVERDGIVIYVQNAYKRKVNGSGARYSFHLIDGKFYLKSVETDVATYGMKVIYNDTAMSVFETSQIYEELIRNILTSENVKKQIGDTINVLYNYENYLAEYGDIGIPSEVDGRKIYPVNFFNSQSNLAGNGGKCVIVSYSIDKDGNIVCYLSTAKMRKKYKSIHDRVFEKKVVNKYILRSGKNHYMLR